MGLILTIARGLSEKYALMPFLWLSFKQNNNNLRALLPERPVLIVRKKSLQSQEKFLTPSNLA
jgi:hypothetical protein